MHIVKNGRDKMQNFDKNLIITFVILLATMYLFHRSMFKFKKLTTYQRLNRSQLITKQGFILAFILAFAYCFDYILKNYLYYFFVEITQKQITLDMFVVYGFVIITAVLILFSMKVKSYIKSKDERVVNINQETTYFKPVPKKVKKIKHYSHYYNGVQLERSSKDYTIQAVKLNIDLNDIESYKIEQEATAIEIKDNKFYRFLIDYINFKSKIFKFPKIEQVEIEECSNMLDFKILIFNRFQNLNNNRYFVSSITQLFQISNPDETEFLTFLRDSQHNKFSSRALKHACLFIQMGVLK